MTIKVKPLNWFEVARYRHGGKYTADGYTIRYIEGFFILDFASESKTDWHCPTLEAAKAAAQADYEASILSAIEPVDPATIRAEALREAAERIALHVELMEAIGAKWPVRTADKVAAILNLIDKEQDQ